MHYTTHEKIIFAINVLGMIGFTIVFLSQGNGEFLFYVAVLVFLMALVLWSHTYFHYSTGLLWALTAWLFLHVIGGGVEYAPGDVFYNLMIIPIIGEPYNVLKYDQVVHFFGFWTSTVLAFHVLKPSLVTPVRHVKSVIFIVVMTSVGLSAVNEIVEFLATVLMPHTNVGGYENTAIDLIANFCGALCAGVYIAYTRFIKKNEIS